jgi:2-hydroxy-3-oxopropionate reductase
MMDKDLGIVLDTARAYGMPLPSVAVHAQLYADMLELGMRDLDNSAVIGVLERMAGVQLEVEGSISGGAGA